MIGISMGEVSPIIAGQVYCSMIEACQEISDYGRAAEWTSRTHPMDRGAARLGLLHGSVRRAPRPDHAGSEAPSVQRSKSSTAPSPAILEIDTPRPQAWHWPRWATSTASAATLTRPRRLRTGDWLWLRTSTRTGVVVARARSHHGRDQRRPPALGRATGPGPPLPAARRLCRGPPRGRRTRRGANRRRGTDRYRREASGVRRCRQTAHQARATCLLDAGDASASAREARGATSLWRSLEAPYDVARCQVVLGRALRDLGDADSAATELGHALRVFHWLGAAPAERDVLRLMDPCSTCWPHRA